MSKHSGSENRISYLLLAAALVFAFAFAVIKLAGGNTVNSVNSKEPASSEITSEQAEDDQQSEQFTHNYADQIKASQEKNEAPAEPENTAEANVDGERIVFGQKPQSTENADPDEPDYVNTEAPSAETVAEEPESSEGGTGEVSPQSETTETPSAPSAGDTPVTSEVTDDWLILANKTHHLSEDYWPGDMVTVSSCVEGVGNNDTKKMRKVAADALEELIKGAADAGYQIKMRTGFRSYSYQASLFSSYAQKNGEEAANKYSARAGESEHQTGLCCDVSSPSVGWSISYEYGKTDEGKWLTEHCHEYGFIVRYLEGKEDITGYNYEPWHIRYVGVDAATEIFNKGICFEEYLGITD